DFYASGGIPIGSQVINGEMLKTSVDWSSIGFDENNKPTIGTIAFSGWASGTSGSFDVANVNATRYADQLILYNSYLGNNTGTNENGTEISLTPIDNWIVNDTIQLLVGAIETGIGSMSISAGEAILSGHGSAAAYLNNWQTGDTVQLYLGLNPTLPRLTQLVGGNYKFLENGVYTGSTNTDLHPRTFAGINADSTTLFLAVVDGRQPGSIGMRYQQLADYMISLGAVHAVNLDGGGSSTLVVHNVVENSLYTDERTVANALMVVSNAPEDSLMAIQLQPDNFRQFLGSTQTIEVSGWDQYFNPRDVTMADVSFSIISPNPN
ncbi:MAG: phosphodiester glycosidase family protein, partial [Planctomycetes bacterium]|nr:phosphodiester glycosidase family protein [Planctomycetota bacterium]